MYVFVFMSLCACTSLYSHTLFFYILFDDEYSQVYITWGENAPNLNWYGNSPESQFLTTVFLVYGASKAGYAERNSTYGGLSDGCTV